MHGRALARVSQEEDLPFYANILHERRQARGIRDGDFSGLERAVVVGVEERHAAQGQVHLRAVQGVHGPQCGAEEDQRLDQGVAIAEVGGDAGAFTMPQHGGATRIDERVSDHTRVGPGGIGDQELLGPGGVHRQVADTTGDADPPLVVA